MKIAYNKLFKRDKLQLAFARSSLILANYNLTRDQRLPVSRLFTINLDLETIYSHAIVGVLQILIDKGLQARK